MSFVLLFQFFACLFLIFAAEAVAGILGFLYRDRVGFLCYFLFQLVVLNSSCINPSIFYYEIGVNLSVSHPVNLIFSMKLLDLLNWDEEVVELCSSRAILPTFSQLKGAQSRLNSLKSFAKLFKFVVFQSVSIFSILNHPCSFMLCYNFFDVFLSL